MKTNTKLIGLYVFLAVGGLLALLVLIDPKSQGSETLDYVHCPALDVSGYGVFETNHGDSFTFTNRSGQHLRLPFALCALQIDIPKDQQKHD